MMLGLWKRAKAVLMSEFTAITAVIFIFAIFFSYRVMCTEDMQVSRLDSIVLRNLGTDMPVRAQTGLLYVY